MGIVAHDAGGVGGMETHIQEIALGLARRGYPVTVYATTCPFAGEAGVRWIVVPSPHPTSLRLPLFALATVVRLWRWRPDVLITTGAIAPVRADYAVVHFCHHAFARRHGRRPASRAGLLWAINGRAAQALSLVAERVLYRPRWSRGLVAVSADTAEEVRRHVPGPLPPIDVVENGVDTRRFCPRPDLRAETRAELGLGVRDRLLLFVGGDWELKRLWLAVRALAEAPAQWHLAVVGEGDRARYRAVAEALGVASRLHLVGRRPDPVAYYAAADLLVQPSRSETFSLVVLEACACGLGVVTTLDSGLIRGMVEAGAAVQVEGSPERLAAAIADLGDERLAAMGAAAREAAKTRDWCEAVERFESLVIRACSSAPTAGRKTGR